MVVVTGIAIVTGSVILGITLTQRGDDGANDIFSFLPNTAKTASSSPIDAEAAALPLDVKANFPLLEMSGDAKDNPLQMKIDSDFIDPDANCEFCYMIEFTPGATGEAGAMLKAEKPFNLKDAKSLTLFARGESGGENVEFNVAGKYVDGVTGAGTSKIMKFAFTSEKTTLKNDWQKYQIDLSNADLRDITHGFGFALEKSGLQGSGKPVVIYLKGITFNDLPAEKPLRASTN